MKIIGLIVVFFSATAVGVLKANTYREYEAELNAFVELLYFIKQEILSYLTPQCEIYKKFQSPVLEKNGFLSILRYYSQDGEDSPLLRALEKSEYLKTDREVQEILISFAGNFGTLCTNDECNRCDRTIHSLEEIIKKRKKENSEKIRLCQSIGSMVGMGLVLLLW